MTSGRTGSGRRPFALAAAGVLLAALALVAAVHAHEDTPPDQEHQQARIRADLRSLASRPDVRAQLRTLAVLWGGAPGASGGPREAAPWQRPRGTPQVGDLTVECALCGIVVNELEGFVLQENATLPEIVAFLEHEVCGHLSGEAQKVCDVIAAALPSFLQRIAKHDSVSEICVDLGLCARPFANHTDPAPVPKMVLNLDAAPEKRWDEVCAVPAFRNGSQFLVGVMQRILPGGGHDINKVGEFVNAIIEADLGAEIRGCAAQLGIPYGWATLFNLGYEVSDACSSVIAQEKATGHILHARNLDFYAGMGFTDTLKGMTVELEFQRGGKTQFIVSTFAGMVGALSGQKPHAFSVTIDTRFYPQGIKELFYELIAAMTEMNATLVTFLSRKVLDKEWDYNAALDQLSNGKLVADVYYILAGVAPAQGAVISRQRENASDVWVLDPPGR